MRMKLVVKGRYDFWRKFYIFFSLADAACINPFTFAP